jgi:hypothetical protein
MMANNSLSVFKSDDGIELVINTVTGEAFATQAGYVRMSGKAKMTISDRVKLVRDGSIKEAEMDTGYGFKGVRLIPAKLVFTWLIKDNPELALAMGEVGATVYIHQLADYKVSSQPVVEPPKVLTSFDRANAVNSLAASLQFLGMEIQNPRFKQGVQDLVGDMLGLTTNYLPEAEQTEQWFGVAERAEQLGYSKSAVVKYRSGMGRFVKQQGLTSRMEKRLCNGTQRDINLYLVTDELDHAITQYMQSKGGLI